ncbi:zinc ABC transporter substrate-binding protein [Marinobacter profundi]|uniref:High-affinity zinc uptake system protein ZnuA n=1 Tax=Marinobacter profundi TaxID=2666256 RepID=A0A2G1UPM0_9GAMM|nr:zinc ABC transporter substrate-binding protein [Marinobacter profundi]PHQ16413.1 ABC transporter substrate-binding protein [Marinobacter profundi]
MILSRLARRLAPATLVLFAGATQAAPEVVASIKPVELLVRAVAPDNATITTLVPPGASPHNYQLKPSQRQDLEGADAIFWIGPDMETFLTRLLSGRDFSERSHALTPTDDQGHHEEHDGHDEPDTEPTRAATGHDGHDHGEGEDPHLWLDPMLALDMAREIHRQLSGLPDVDQTALDNNLDHFEQRLLSTEVEIRTRLEAARSISLFTYHDAFSRFAEHYGLQIAGVLTLSPERSPGARHVAEVQRKLRQSENACLLTEPQFERQWWRSITEGIPVTFSTWDPLATDIVANADGYLAFQSGLADAVLRCLANGTGN